MFTVFANMLINSPERVEELKDSFESFCDSSDDWLINIRGKHRSEAIAFLKERLKANATFFELTDDSRGWSKNALDMLAKAKHDYVFIWVEDHMNVSPHGYLQKVAQEMIHYKADYLMYSWWGNGVHVRHFEPLPRTNGNTIDVADIDSQSWTKLLAAGQEPFLVSLHGIFQIDFLKKLLKEDTFMLPLNLTQLLFSGMTLLNRVGLKFDKKKWFVRTNRLMGYRLRKLSTHEAPHDIEKERYRFDILPFRTAIAHREIFACMDVDYDPNIRSSLVTRGLYPVRNTLTEWDPTETVTNFRAENTALSEGKSFGKPYCFYVAKGVRQKIVREYIRVVKGKIRITVKDQIRMLEKGQGASFYPNLPHKIDALDDSEVIRYVADFGVAPHYIEA